MFWSHYATLGRFNIGNVMLATFTTHQNHFCRVEVRYKHINWWKKLLISLDVARRSNTKFIILIWSFLFILSCAKGWEESIHTDHTSLQRLGVTPRFTRACYYKGIPKDFFLFSMITTCGASRTIFTCKWNLKNPSLALLANNIHSLKLNESLYYAVKNNNITMSWPTTGFIHSASIAIYMYYNVTKW